MSHRTSDILVIGAGMAGASIAAELSRTHRVTMIERESAAGYHSTGRSAALFSEIYGGAAVRALSRASRDFLFSPPPNFTETALVKSRGALYVASATQLPAFNAFLADPDVAKGVKRLGPNEARRLCPILRTNIVDAALFEPDASDVDVNALHQGYLGLFRKCSGVLVNQAEVQSLERHDGTWRASTSGGTFNAPIVVNAAGAWVDDIATMAGAAPQKVAPCRRTALLIEMPKGLDFTSWPMTIDIDETFYFKPDARLMLISPADETPVPPSDVQPDELDVAVAIDRFEKATTCKVARVRRKWAGLRTFAPDRAPVIGFDPDCEGFFWLAGQGGYGIQIAPAAARFAAALIRRDPLPRALNGFDPTSVSPSRRHLVAGLNSSVA